MSYATNTSSPRSARRAPSAARGSAANLAGAAAEQAVARAYVAEGARLLELRWRCREGEIDLILATDDGLVFVEVKARRSHAADCVTPRQWVRIAAAASRYLAERARPDVCCRFDLAMVDRHGRIERIENAIDVDGW